MYRIITKIPYFNYNKTFDTFGEMQAWVIGCIGNCLDERTAVGTHKTLAGCGQFTITLEARE